MSKNESVLGIYSGRTGVEKAISVWKTPAFRMRTRTRLCFFQKIQVPRNWRQRRKHPKGQLRAQAREQRLVACWGGWLSGAHSPSRDWGLSSQPVLFGRPWPEREPMAPWAGLPERPRRGHSRIRSQKI